MPLLLLALAALARTPLSELDTRLPASELDLAAIEQACAAADPQACTQLGMLLLVGDQVPPDARRGRALLEDACAAGFAVACVDLGWERARRKGLLDRKARQLVVDGCDALTPTECNNVGMWYMLGWGVPQDGSMALSIFEHLCTGSTDVAGVACANLAGAHVEGFGDQDDAVRAVEVLDRGCTDREAGACHGLALMYRAGLGVRADHRTALAFDEAACALEQAAACEAAGRAVGAGVGVNVAPGRAWRLLRTACELDVARCSELAADYLDGEVLPREPQRAVDLLGVACDGRLLAACWELADLRLDGPTPLVDPAAARVAIEAACEQDLGGCHARGVELQDRRAWDRAEEVLGVACRLDHLDACLLLAGQLCPGSQAKLTLQSAGEPLPAEDWARAAGIYERLCSDHQHLDACAEWGLHLHVGMGVAEDPTTALEVWRDACERGHQHSCWHIADKTPGPERIEIAEMVCDRHPALCHPLGFALWKGQDVEADPERARLLFERSCEAESATGCMYRGDIVERGEDELVIPEEAIPWYERSCELGSWLACTWVGRDAQ